MTVKYPHPWEIRPLGPDEWCVVDANGVQLLNFSADEAQYDDDDFINEFSAEMNRLRTAEYEVSIAESAVYRADPKNVRPPEEPGSLNEMLRRLMPDPPVFSAEIQAEAVAQLEAAKKALDEVTTPFFDQLTNLFEKGPKGD